MIEKTVSSEKIYEGKIIDLYVEKVQINEEKFATREIVRPQGAVCVLAQTPERKFVLVRQFRKAMEDYLLEIPAGKLEKGEEPGEAILRELKEETGYMVQSMDYVTSFYTSPGFCDEKIFLYFAKLGEKGSQNLDEDEFIDILEFSLDELFQMINEGKIQDAKTILAISLFSAQKGLESNC